MHQHVLHLSYTNPFPTQDRCESGIDRSTEPILFANGKTKNTVPLFANQSYEFLLTHGLLKICGSYLLRTKRRLT